MKLCVCVRQQDIKGVIVTYDLFQMLLKSILIVFIAIHICPKCAWSSVNTVFLRKVNRFQDNRYIDYYFCCNVVGQFLAWQYNNSDSLAAFLPTNIGMAVVSRLSDYQYTTTLLSSRANTNDTRLFELDSILVVSFKNTEPLPFVIACSNEGELSTAIFTSDSFASSSQSSEGVTLDYVLSSNIVRRSKTHIFVCGTGFEFQFLEIFGTRIAFSQNDMVGDRKNVLSHDQHTVNIQGILMAKEPFNTTTLLIVADNSVINVRCFTDNNHQVMLSSLMSSPLVTTQENPQKITIYSTKYHSTDRNIITSGNSDGMNYWFILRSRKWECLITIIFFLQVFVILLQ